jgi:LysM repeat protein
MKILKLVGIAAGIHAVIFVIILANPGCSSSTADQPKVAAAAPPADPPADATAAPVPVASDSSSVPVFFSPTRPGTAAAAALLTQPASEIPVTPAATYEVQRGDSLWSIAKKNHIKISALVAANDLRSGAPLRLGQKLIIPGAPAEIANAPSDAEREERPAAAPAPVPSGGVKHVVRAGETLGAIARKYGVRMGDIATANNIADPKKIRPGQTLIIPGGHESGRSSRPAAAAPPPPAETSLPAAPAAPAELPPAPPAAGDSTDTSSVPVINVDQASPKS